MPEGIPYSSTNVVAGTGLELNYVGNRCFAYNLISISGSEDTMLEFKTGKDAIQAKIQIGGASATNDPTAFKLYLNDLEVNGLYVDGTKDYPGVNGAQPFICLLPPYTNVKVTETRISGSTAADYSVSLVGTRLL